MVCVWYGSWFASGTVHGLRLVRFMVCVWYGPWFASGTVHGLRLVRFMVCVWYGSWFEEVYTSTLLYDRVI
jgi:ribosomal protein L30/L7E